MSNPESGQSTPTSSVYPSSLTASLLRVSPSRTPPPSVLMPSAQARPYRFATQCATVDNPDPSHKDQYGSSSVPIYQTATFKGMGGAYDYSRSGNPTRSHLGESQMRSLGREELLGEIAGELLSGLVRGGQEEQASGKQCMEVHGRRESLLGAPAARSRCWHPELTLRFPSPEHHVAKISSAQHAFAVTSGMGALDVIFRLLKPGDEIIAGNDLYGGSNRLLGYLKTHNGIHTHHVPTTDPSSLLPILTDPTANVAMVLLETPTNPLLQIADIAAISALVHKHCPNALVVVDNTMMSPYLQRPLEHGADVVYDSGTKYLSGHHDLMAGVITCSRDDVAKVSPIGWPSKGSHSRIIRRESPSRSTPSETHCPPSTRSSSSVVLRRSLCDSTASRLRRSSSPSTFTPSDSGSSTPDSPTTPARRSTTDSRVDPVLSSVSRRETRL
jgi:hypothetical protein